jgi:hypothetical protein
MKNILTHLCTGAMLLVFAGAMTPSAHAQDKAGSLAIIVNKASKLSDLSLADLQKYFRADKTKAPDGVKIVIVMADAGRPERAAALKTIYKMSEAEYNDYFVGQTFTGAVAAAPKSLPSPSAIKLYVAQTPGAIAYVQAGDTDDSVAVLKIGGKSPGDADYPLKVQ